MTTDRTICIGDILAAVDYGSPASYLTLPEGADVVSSDGEVVGKVEHVLADEEEDIFDGLVIDIRLGPGGMRFVDADQVDEVYERAVVLDVPAAEVESLPEPRPAPASMESHGEEDSEGPLERKLRRAWDLLSGNY
jgi:sporulation protein YlmC with PRC-barrel domain